MAFTIAVGGAVVPAIATAGARTAVANTEPGTVVADADKRVELHGRASEALAELMREQDEDARTVASYYRSCLRGADRAAEQLVTFARARGLLRP